MYGVVFGKSAVGYYKYSPFALLLFIPATILPFKAAAIIYYILLGFISIYTILISCYLVVNKVYHANARVHNSLLFITLLFSVTFLNRELMLGNTSIILLMIICIGLYMIETSNNPAIGLFYAIAIFFKPYLMVVILPVLAYKKFRILYQTILFSVIFFIIPFIIAGWLDGIQLYKDWFQALVDHNVYQVSPRTIDAILNRFVLAGPDIHLIIYIIAVVVFVYILFKILRRDRSQSATIHRAYRIFLLESFTMLALIPNLVNTDNQQLLFTIPLIAFLIYFLFQNRKIYLIIPCVILLFFFSVDQPDILGWTIAEKFQNWGIPGISNLMLIGVCWVIYYRDRQNFFSTREL